tara:strand:- start:8058 stop:8768 length:711 start_codon:yes stop_codon:yes gene_type:complete
MATSFYDILGDLQTGIGYGKTQGLVNLGFDVQDEKDHLEGLIREYEKNITDAGYDVEDYKAGQTKRGALPQAAAVAGKMLGKGKWATAIAGMHPIGQLALLAGIGFGSRRLFGKKKPKVEQVDFTQGPEGRQGRFLSESRKDATMDQETSTRFISEALKGSKTADLLGSVSTAATLLSLTGGKDFWNMDASTPIIDDKIRPWFQNLFSGKGGDDTSLMNKSLQYYQHHLPGRQITG